MRIGFGYDVHSFSEGRELLLGGVSIPHDRGLLGHSDGDVLIHALSDALLGAVGKGDIGFYFPDTDPSTTGIDSRKILEHVLGIVKERGLRISNIDTVIVCETPKIGPFRDDIRKNLALITGIETDRISVKAKTSEGLGFIGRKEAIAVYAVCLLEG
jgi:2-C-methyl-D-erythritol 2,4-cyclodiphosphate synthase